MCDGFDCWDTGFTDPNDPCMTLAWDIYNRNETYKSDQLTMNQAYTRMINAGAAATIALAEENWTAFAVAVADEWAAAYEYGTFSARVENDLESLEGSAYLYQQHGCWV